ncbi:hypothetical protein BDZ90DRAFT_229654 [Jaminaea rosea]|uniref:Uncharacterized protein n=1 Tax=Jaminaea rosea TaxID=1569628 RepID=A0A316UZI9_9BASI|nr:hypothetical protein BDZ90DRAFT_229654 [Jaminaea rosea]PWN30642.1 hypothetical protein BDZ90DRAFT_229654 [Jaminaea rosea]
MSTSKEPASVQPPSADEPALTPSVKALGKRKHVDRQDEAAPFEVSGAGAAPRTTKKQASKPSLWQSLPTGPWCNPKSLQRPERFKRSDEYYLSPKAWKLPFSKLFLDQLTVDVHELLEDWEVTWQHQATHAGLPRQGSSKEQHSQPPKPSLALFLDVWKKRYWHLVSLTWSEDVRTRAAFFESTTRVFLGAFKSPTSTTHHKVGCIFAILLLYTCQTRWPDPLPGVTLKAWDWARPEEKDRKGKEDCGNDEDENGAEDDEWDPFAHLGINSIKIEGDVYGQLRQLPKRARKDMTYSAEAQARIRQSHPSSSSITHSVDDVINSPLHDVTYALAELDRRKAWHILPSSRLKGVRNPPFLPLYEELNEEEKLRRQGDWGRLVDKGNDGEEGARTFPLSRSDVLLIRAANALGVPLETVFTWLGDGDSDDRPSQTSLPTGHATLRRHLEHDERRADGKDHTQHRPMTLWRGSWREKPFRPLELPRVAKWLGPMAGDDGHEEEGFAATAGKLAELDEEIEVYMQLVDGLEAEGIVERGEQDGQ